MASHLEPPYTAAAAVALPVTERLTSRTIILPLYHDMADADQVRVTTALDECLREVTR